MGLQTYEALERVQCLPCEQFLKNALKYSQPDGPWRMWKISPGLQYKRLTC